MNSFTPSSFHLISMPTSHIFVVENGVSKKVSKLSRRYQHYKKLLSTAIPNMSSAQDTAVTNADTADTATAGCAYARASLSDADDFSDQDNDSLLETSHPIGHSIGLKSDGGVVGESVLGVGDSVQFKSSLSETSNNLLRLSAQLNFWQSKFTVMDGDQIIDVSSAACGESSSIPVGATQQTFPYPGTVYQFDPLLFQPDNDKNEFDLNDAEIKLYSLMKSPCTVDGCKLIRHRVDKNATFRRKRCWYFICSHGKVMRQIDDSHFAPHSVGKMHVTYQHAKKKKSKASLKGMSVIDVFTY